MMIVLMCLKFVFVLVLGEVSIVELLKMFSFLFFIVFMLKLFMVMMLKILRLYLWL